MNNFVLKKQLAVVAAALVIMSSASGCGKSDSTASDNSLQDSTEINSDAFSFVNTEFVAEDLEVGYDDTVAVNVELNGTSAEISGSGATENNGVITVSEAGVYVFSGELSNGRIIVDAGKNDKVRLIMNGVKISCSDNSPVFINQADKVIMTLNDNTENALVDGKTYNLSDDDSNVDGAVFFRDDLTLNGSGSLTVTANYKHGIVCKDDLVITGGKYVINSASGGIYGKDSLRIKQGDFDITSGSNGIKATNSDESDKGYVYISDGSYKITAENDGIEAVTSLLVDGGDFRITTGGGSANASVKSDGQPNENWGRWGGMKGQSPNGVTPPDGNDTGMNKPLNEDAMQGNPPEMPNDENVNNPDSESSVAVESSSESSSSSESTTDEESTSAKGIKADGNVGIRGGNITIDSSDDSVHSNGNIIYSGGELTLSSGDDGTHADGNLLVTGGTITVKKSYEGLEGVNVTIQGGNISLTSSDDGINAAGGSDTGSEDRMGKDSFSANASQYLLKISGGVINIIAEGDGIDSNGNLVIEGGETYISGPTNSGNGAIDFGDGASSWITGGTIVACGSSGMAESFGEDNFTQNSVLHNFSSIVSGGTEVQIIDSDGNVIISYTPEKNYQSVVFSSPEIKNGTYTICAGDISEEITINSVVTSNGSGGMQGGRGNMLKGERKGNIENPDNANPENENSVVSV